MLLLQLEEVVFSEPQENFYKRMMATTPTVQMPPSEVAQFVSVLDESEDLSAIQEARQKVAQISAGLKGQLQEPPS
jgi:ABC-type enterochelin transport system substrate-binding protein